MTQVDITTQIIRSGYDRKRCWVHARPGLLPGPTPSVVITTHQLDLTGDDVFHEIGDMRSDDLGKTWSELTPHPQTLGRRDVGNDIIESISDFSPMWHEASQTLLGTGHTVRYKDEKLAPMPRPRDTAYSVYDPKTRTWANWRKLELPDDPKFFSEGAGSTQRVDLPNGDILLPTYFAPADNPTGAYTTTVMRCTFDGQTLRYVEHGTELTLPTGRGFVEGALAQAAGRFFLSLRNNDSGYVATSDDGLHFDQPRPWTFDDGSNLGNYNTQQRWVTHNDELYLVYTRRGANNDHVMRHRAPLFMGQVDLDRLCVIRDTEQILAPERGARLGNFGVARISEHESWVTVSEWMQTTLPDPFDCTICEKYGSDNSFFLAKVQFSDTSAT